MTTAANLAPLADPRALTPARKVLADVFGYQEFRPGQPEIIAAVLAGRDTLAVMPTGGGKSVCFQVPALLQGEGLTVVVSPLLALMKDQADALLQAGIAVAAVNSTMPREEQARTMEEAAAGRLKLLYVAPERFGDGAFMAGLRRVRVALLAIDEAHCISAWGHDFRPSYRDLGGVRPRLGNPPIIALTATADPRVRADIIERLQLHDPVVHVAGFDRPNLRFDVVRCKNLKEKAQGIADRLKELGSEESAIVYCGTRKRVEEVADFLQQQRIRCARYHAGMEDADRKRIQDAFARDSLRIMVATNAFGMGIDKPDVRLVLHHDLPDSLESYYQEAGRAGRDGAPAECVLFYSPRDRSLREFFIELAHPEAHVVVDVYRALASFGGERRHIREVMTSDDEPGINAAVQALVDSGLARRQGQIVWATRGDGEGEIDTAGLEEHREHAQRKLDSMQAYAESMTCLRRRILSYFGEEGSPDCGNCGPCIAPRRKVADHTEAEDRVFAALRAVRRAFAEEANVPPYAVFSDATLREMARKLPRTRLDMLAISGVGQVKYERYGEVFLGVTRAVAPAEPEAVVTLKAVPSSAPPVPFRTRSGVAIPATARRTLELHRAGLTIAEIAAQRGLAPSTITQHMVDLVLGGEIADISPWVDESTLAQIRRVAGELPIGPLGAIKEQLGDAVSYDQLHLARAWLNNRRDERPVSHARL